jgi:hypothetical protein
LRRRGLALLAAIAVFSVASVSIVERATRHAAPRSPPAAAPPPALEPTARVLASPRASAVAPPLGAPPVQPAPPPESLVARASVPERARAAAALPPPAGAARVDVSFRLDPRLTSGLHMGTRWVSPPTYTRTGDGKTVTVEARARVVGGTAPRSGAKPTWHASQPDMVEISAERGDRVTLTVWRPGESTVTVAGGAATRALTVRAAEVDGALHVDIVR